MPRSRSRSRSYSRSVSHSHRDKKYSKSHKSSGSSSRYKSSRKSHEKDRHRSSRHSKHSSSRNYSRRRRSSSRSSSRSSRSSSRSSRSSSSSSGAITRKVVEEKVKEKSPVIEEKPLFTSVEQIGSNISAKTFQELNEDTFTAKSFTSSAGGKKPPSNIVIDISSNPRVEVKTTSGQSGGEINVPEDTVFHQNLYGNDAARMEKWVKKLYAFRQRTASPN
ncbi:hypothetical protein DMENIID0001_058500 [Sergentomyia squamirostris]